MFPKGSAYSSIGLDIGKSSVKMLQLVKANGKFKILSLACNVFEATDVPDKDAAKKELLIKTIKKTYQTGFFKGKKVITFLPSQEVDLRQITVQSEDPKEIVKAIGFEADSYLPYKAKDAVLDYLEIGETLINGEKKKKVLLAAAQRNKIDEFLDILKGADLKCIAIDILPMAHLRIINQSDDIKKGTAVSVIDVGHEESRASVFYQGTLLLSRGIRFGSNTLTKTIIKELETDASTAEKYKSEYGIIEGEATPIDFQNDEKQYFKEKAPSLILEILKDDLEVLVFEIEKMFNYCSAELRGIKPKKMILTGGGAMVKNLSDYLKRKLEIDVELWNLSHALSNGKKETNSEGIESLSPIFATALGLALREQR